MSSGPPVVIEGLSHYFGRGALRKQILFDITTQVGAGEIIIVTGPSGSGKTTLLTLVGALRSAQEGSIRVLGEELRGAKPAVLERVRKRIGFIFQQHNLVESLSAVRNVELGLGVTGRYRGSALRKRAEEMLEAVGLGERMGHRPEQMSGGQRQRVAIARALVSEPAMLLADEPTASLDKESGREVVDRMKTLAREHGTTILLVTHDNRILDIADRIVHLEDGRLSTFTEAVIMDNQRMMSTLAAAHGKRSFAEQIADMDEDGFQQALEELTSESQRFLEATEMARDMAFRSMLKEGLESFTIKTSRLLDAERASLFLVDRETDELVLRVAEDLPAEGEIRFPVGQGIAGTVAASGKAERVDDAYADPRFNREIDRASGFRTRSILCLPVTNRRGEVFAVAQLLNRRDGMPFDAQDERHFARFIESLGVILETLESISAVSARRGQGDA